MPIYKLRGPFSFVVVDALGPFPETPAGNKYILIFVDYFTRWPEAIAVRDLKTSTFLQVLVDEVLCRYGVPDNLLSDRGSNFVSALAKTLYKTVGIDKLASAPGHPQGQGLVERFNSTLATMMKMYVSAAQTDWDVYLPRLLWAYRTAHQETLGDSPFFCLHGRDPTQPLHLAFVNQDEPWKSDELPQWKRKQSAWFLATRKLVESQLLRGQNRDSLAKDHKRHVEFGPTDSVWVYQYFQKSARPDDTRIKKLAYHWHGPYRIHEKQGPNTYRIHIPTHPDRIVPINVDRLKAFRGYWTRPYDDEVPAEPEPLGPEGDDTALEPDMLPNSSFLNRVEFLDGDVAYTNTTSALDRIEDRRKERGKEVEYLVRHADQLTYWTPRSRLKDYESYISEYENTRREEEGFPALRRSPRLVDLDVRAAEFTY